MAQRVKLLPEMQEIRVQSLGQEDPLEKEVAAHSSTPAWKIPWMEEPGRLQSMGSQRVRNDWATEHNGSDRLNMAIHVKCLEVPSVVINNINFCHCMYAIVI